MREAFAFRPSKTFCVQVGCGTLRLIVDYKEDGIIHKIRFPRLKDFDCSQTMIEGLCKTCTYQSRRDMKQTIKDLKGREDKACKRFNIACKSAMKKGKLGAYSCADGIARVLEVLVNEEEKKAKKETTAPAQT